MKEVLNFSQKLKDQEKFAKENREIISMNHGARVKVLPGEKNRELFTYGVNGCIVTALLLEYNDVHESIMTHYDPGLIGQNSEFLKNELTQNIKDQKNQAKIIVPGHYEKNINEKWELVPDSNINKQISLLEINLKEKFGDKVEIEIISYDQQLLFGEERQISFIIKPKNTSDTPSLLQWWDGTIKFEK